MFSKNSDFKTCAALFNEKGNLEIYLILQSNSVHKLGKGRDFSFCSPTHNLVGGVWAILINYCKLNISTT